MNKYRLASIALLALCIGSGTAAADDAQTERQKRFEELRKKREEQRKAASAGKGGSNAGGATSTGSAAKSGGATGKGGSSHSGGSGGSASGGGAGKGGATAAPSPDSQLDELRKTRTARRQSVQRELRERWGSALDNPRSRDELKTHGRRVAELARLRSLCEQQKRVADLATVDKLLTREELRHASAMNDIREGKPAAAPGGTP
ncbi:MAG TPA: hypothetical protein VFQ61_17025 [Polyangiaceae bacterium]|nr:hypothetical protein [Polyangiaceae bacterium]